MKVIIDRFEEDFAVVELDGEMLNAPRALFKNAEEGDTVEITVLPRRSAHSADADDKAAIGLFEPDKPAEEKAQEEPSALFNKLRSKRKKNK